MAIKQNSKIQVRRGLQQNLPQLDSAEFGWAIDQQRLFIGNGSYAEGAPTAGMTEILTSVSLARLTQILGSGNGSVQSCILPGVATTPTPTGVVVLEPFENAGFMNYTLIGNSQSRVGRLEFAVNAEDEVSFDDDYTGDLSGIVFSIITDGTSIQVYYTSIDIIEPIVFSVNISSGTGASVPTPPPTAAIIYTVPFSISPVFNAELGQIFNLTLTNNVTSSSFINGLAGQATITFRIIQNSTGNWNFTWPVNVHNGGEINPGPNIKSTQTFALNTDGSLDSIGPMSYS